MKLAGPLADGSPRLRLALRHVVLALEIERRCGADEILQARHIGRLAFTDVDARQALPSRLADPSPLPLFDDLRVGLVYDLAHFRERLPAPVSKFLDPLVD